MFLSLCVLDLDDAFSEMRHIENVLIDQITNILQSLREHFTLETA